MRSKILATLAVFELPPLTEKSKPLAKVLLMAYSLMAE